MYRFSHGLVNSFTSSIKPTNFYEMTKALLSPGACVVILKQIE